MTLPTQTWRISTIKYNVIVAGALITASEIVTGLKSFLDAEDALGNNYWTYCSVAISGNDSYMMFKRKGSPGGTLGTFRAILAGSTGTPSASNIGFNVVSTGGIVYGATSEDHASDNINTSWASGQTLSGKYNKGVRFVNTTSSTLTSTSIVRCFMIECDRMCSIWLHNGSSSIGAAHFTFGEIVERGADSVGLWGHFTTLGHINAAIEGDETTGASSLFPYTDNTATETGGGVYDGAAKALSRVSSGIPSSEVTPLTLDNLQNAQNDTIFILPVVAGSKSAAGATTVFGLGVYRQMRFSFRHPGIITVRDSSNNIKAYSVSPTSQVVSKAIYYDQSP